MFSKTRPVTKEFGAWLLLLVVVLIAVMPVAQAAAPVRVVVPASAGSSLDAVARILAEPLAARWARPVVVENKPGAGGLIGVDVAAKAPKDGTVLALGFNGPLAYATLLYASLPYDPARDLAPVALASTQPNVLAIHAGLPVQTVAQLVAWARTQQGRTTYASVGSGSSSHLAMERLRHEAGFSATHVPFNGSPAAALSVAQGETQMLFAVAAAALPHMNSGQIRLLAVTSARRFPALPALPTLIESGYRDFVADAWNGLVTAAGTSATVVNGINADVNAILATVEVRRRLEQLGMSPGSGTPAAFSRLIAEDLRRWAPIVHAAAIRSD